MPQPVPRVADHVRRVARHRSTSLVAYTVAGVVVVLATFLPWLRSGSSTRTSYDLLGIVERLDIAPDGIVGTSIRGWPLVPLIVTVAVVLAWWQLWVPSIVAAVVSVLYAGGVSLALFIGADGTPITLGVGPLVCAIASIVFLGTAAWMVFTHASDHAAPALPGAPSADPS